jgi:hypothetical protein
VRTVKTLKPGQSGTKGLLRRDGPSLLCVRYRVDDATGERLKTVELVIQRRGGRLRLGKSSVAERIHLETAGGCRWRNGMDRSGHRGLDLGTAHR